MKEQSLGPHACFQMLGHLNKLILEQRGNSA
jgi:hypothetical protein